MSVLLYALPLLFQDDPRPVAETVVTARKIEEPLAGLPLSATVISGQRLEREGLETVRDAARQVPAMLLSEFSARRLSFPFVRGIGSGIEDPAVITYVDDVPQLGFGGVNLPLFDLDRIEFLRGPQGWLYGKNALGGVIALHGAAPAATPEVSATALLGTYETVEARAVFSGPLGAAGTPGDPRANVGLLASARDGYTKNAVTGNRVDDREDLFGRSRVVFTPAEDSELELAFFGERARDGGFALNFLDGPDGLRERPHRIRQDFEGLTHRDVLQPSAVWRTHGDDYDFTSITAWQRQDVLELSDFDFSAIDGVRRRSEDQQRYVYEELRVGTSPDAPWPLSPWRELDWQVGLAAWRTDGDRLAQNTFRPAGAGIVYPIGGTGIDTTRGDFRDTGVGLFGRMTVTFEESLELTVGMRGDLERKEIDRSRTFSQGGVEVPLAAGTDSDTFRELTPHVSLAWHADEDTVTWVSGSGGYKAGGFNLSAPGGNGSYDPETSFSTEIGVRRTFPELDASAALSVFWIDWRDMQLAQFDALAGGYVDNAGESWSRGLELEGRVGLRAGVHAFGSLGWMKSEIEEFVDAFGADTAGNELPFAPRTTLALGLDAEGELAADTRWTGRIAFQDVGRFYHDPGNLSREDYELVDVAVGVVRGALALELWVRNLTDEAYVPVAFQPDPTDATLFVGENGPPRVVGFTLSYRP